MRLARATLSLLTSAAVAACAVGPNYHRPAAPISSAFKEADGWARAAPADLLDRGPWWTLFNDPVLNDLEARVTVSNQNVAAAEAAYRQSQALVREQQATLFPTLSVDGSATRTGGGSRGGSGSVVGGNIVTSGGKAVTTYRASANASWEPDVWGRVRRSIENARANSQASAADLAAATLSAQGQLATDYLGLREADAEIALLQASVDAFRKSLTVTQNRFNAGVAPHSDVLQSQTQLDNALADLAGVQRQRQVFEHAVAMLVGQAPGDFTLAPAAWNNVVPEVPAGVPSTLLQRRPDVAIAERRMAAANATIGVETAAWFPTFNLTGAYDFTSTQISRLFSASNALWSLGLSTAETVFNGGLTSARVHAARAAYDQSVAQYRQTVLSALQEVEDELVASRILAQQYELRRASSAAADAAEQMELNRYRAGQASWIELAQAQNSAYAARRALAQTGVQRQTADVALIQALGGGWKAPGP